MTNPPRMGLGLAALGRPGYINLTHADDFAGETAPDLMEARTWQVLDRAYAAGVRYFDAARSYGRAEEFLGNWLRNRKPAGASVGSKWGYTYTADWQTNAETHEVKDHSLATLRRQWAESRANLGDSIDLYQIHSAVLATGVLTNSDVVAGLAEIKSEGVRIGLSLSGTGQSETLEQARQVEVNGRPLFDAVQATYNIFEQSAGPALHAAHAGGMQVIIKEGLANGRLTDRNSLAADHDRLVSLRRQAERPSATIDAFALAFVLDAPFVDIVLSGAATTEQLHSNLNATKIVFDEKARGAAEEARQNSADYWAFRATLPWQ